MPAIHAKRRVNHSAQEMFDLVADVERYPEFVPHCQKHIIICRKRTEDGEVLITDMTVGRGPLCETMRSRDTLDRRNCCILIEASGGPLRCLRTVWTFQAQDNESCEVGFDLCYEFSGVLIQLLAGRIFEAMFVRFVQAFERRANMIYGDRKRASPSRHRGRLGLVQPLPLDASEIPARP
jgi:coenzyme Q-binding protein COQ10